MSTTKNHHILVSLLVFAVTDPHNNAQSNKKIYQKTDNDFKFYNHVDATQGSTLAFRTKPHEKQACVGRHLALFKDLGSEREVKGCAENKTQNIEVFFSDSDRIMISLMYLSNNDQFRYIIKCQGLCFRKKN